jgi:thioredoxin 1
MRNLVIVAVIIIIGAVAIIPSLKNNSFDVDKFLAKAKQENKLILLELSSATCSICKRMQPYLTQIEQEYSDKVVIKIVDIEVRTDIARHFQVTAIPTQVFIDRDGQVYFKHVGYMSKSDIINVLKQKGL